MPSTSNTKTYENPGGFQQENLFNVPKTKASASAPAASPRYAPNYSNFSYFSNNQVSKEEGVQKQVEQKSQKSCKEEGGDFNYNDLQQFLSKQKIKDSHQDFVADSLLNFLQRKNFEKTAENNFPGEEDNSKREEDPKLMNELLAKISEKEEKRFKGLDDKKKKILDDLEKINKRDAMSHYQDDKSHHKRSSNYGDFNQWDFLNQGDFQSPGNNRRGHLPFQSQSAWNPMGMGMSHQSNPYYTNPHVMPAHAHEYNRYNQWNAPNDHKNIQNAHSHNVVLPQNKNSVNKNQEFNQKRTAPHDIPQFPKNPSCRNPTLKTVGNPLTDLQMLVENEKPEEKGESCQQETVDLSAHSDAKHKDPDPKPENEAKPANEATPANEAEDVSEKPVELTAKPPDNQSEKRISSTEKEEEEPVPEPEKPSDIRKSEDDDEIAKELALLDGADKKPEPEQQSTPPKPSNETPATSTNEIVENLINSKPPKRKSEEEPQPENKKVFIEVENELEKMFEGVEERKTEESNDLPTVSSTSTDVKPSTSESGKKTPRKKPPRNARSSRLSSGQSSSSENQSHSKKKKKMNLGNKEDGSKKRVKRNLCDVIDSSRKGPVLHVEGSRDCPTSVIVVNYPKGDDEDEKDKRDKSLGKKQSLNTSRIRHHNELDYRARSRNGLFSSTLSARYDAHTTDYSWICVFCKKGPHYNALGDLFGPYIITKDENNSLCDFSGDEKDISDAQKRGGRNKKSIRSNNMVDHFQKMSKKLRRHHSGESNLTGLTLVSDEQVDELKYEVWVHEQCAVWSPNVCLIGSRIVGMQEAIWFSVKTMCSKCGEMGANIGCVHRNCPNRSHYDCARQSGWSLEQETFISTCHIHKSKS